jgi:hypothetical protein
MTSPKGNAMTLVTCQRPIIWGFSMWVICVAGCCSTQMGSKLAWWKKDSAIADARLNELEPPAAKIQPLVEELAKDKLAMDQQAPAPTRSPYPIDGEEVALGTSSSTPPSESQMPQPSMSAPLDGHPSADAMTGNVPVGYTAPTTSAQNKAAQVGQMIDTVDSAPQGSAAQPATRFAPQSTTPMRVVNPFSGDGASTSKPPAVSIPNSTATANPADYSQTPYQSFAPRSPDYISKVSTVTPLAGASSTAAASTTGNTPLQPLQPRSEPSQINSPPPLQIPESMSASTNTSAGGTSIPSADAGTSAPGNPESLLQAPGNFAPGSIRTARGDTGTATPAPTAMPMTPTSSTNPISSPTSTTTPTAAPSLGGGGSFQFSR